MKHICYLFIFLFYNNFCKGQSTLTFSIDELYLLSGQSISYVFDGKQITIKFNHKEKYKQKMDLSKIQYIDSVVRSIDLESLDNTYSTGIYDGMWQVFKFNIDGVEKKIILKNYYLRNLYLFLKELNSLIDKEKRLILIDEEWLNKPDTLIYYYPDFYDEPSCIDLENTFLYKEQEDIIIEDYISDEVICFKNDSSFAFEFNSIKFCDCYIIYSPKQDSHFKKKRYWRVYRKDNFWIMNFYNDENQKITTKYKYVIIEPKRYKIVKEEVYYHDGYKPSVEKYRYYKTHLINKE